MQFILKSTTGDNIRFNCYTEDAPVTSAAFMSILPFARTFFHARISGQEIWIDNAPELDIIQENASVFTQPGEVVISPISPSRNKIAKCMGIFYGEGKLVDGGNIFGKVVEEDFELLQTLGDRIWRSGAEVLTFESGVE
ncbi:MAG: hypothetical protein C5B59_20455 [Bacteroidetes bacterium]|nr:MAG: hypothetical protein C5B59_20455 [Bacteroidota bacterium]